MSVRGRHITRIITNRDPNCRLPEDRRIKSLSVAWRWHPRLHFVVWRCGGVKVMADIRADLLEQVGLHRRVLGRGVVTGGLLVPRGR